MAIQSLVLFVSILFVSTISAALSHHAVEEIGIPAIRRREVNETVPYGTAPNNVSTYSIILRGYEGCEANSYKYGTNVDWTSWITDGFKEYNTMCQGQPEYSGQVPVIVYPPVDWTSAAAIEFLGPGYKNKDYRNAIQANLDQHSNMDYAWFLGWKIHVRCDDPAQECLGKDVATEAYTMHGTDDTCSPYENQINFCPNFFKLPTLGNAMASASGYQNTRNNIKMYYNRAVTWSHEVMHIGWVATPIATGRTWMTDEVIYGEGASWKAYRVLDTKYFSYSGLALPTAPYNNPQNYAYFLLANYVKKLYDWYPSQAIWLTNDDPPSPPPRPQQILGVGNSSASVSAAAAKMTCRPTVLGGNVTAHHHHNTTHHTTHHKTHRLSTAISASITASSGNVTLATISRRPTLSASSSTA